MLLDANCLDVDEKSDNGLTKPAWMGETDVWGVRRFGPPFSPDVPSFYQADKQARSVEFTTDATRQDITLRYSSPNAERANLLQRVGERVFQQSAKAREIDGQSCELVVKHTLDDGLRIRVLMGHIAMP